jgi:hypothetical protein
MGAPPGGVIEQVPSAFFITPGIAVGVAVPEPAGAGVVPAGAGVVAAGAGAGATVSAGAGCAGGGCWGGGW